MDDYPHYPTAVGYMTEAIRRRYIEHAVPLGFLPAQAHRMAQIVSLCAANDVSKPILFWQLYSVLGSERIRALVRRFYARVFADEHWFRSVFERVGPLDHHVMTQSAMWIDVFGGGMTYHGGEYRLRFHHHHNAMSLMNQRGAERWVALMAETLDDPGTDFTSDSRVRPAVNTFLSFFMGKYAEDFGFENQYSFGETNPPWKRTINFLNMSEAEIEALSDHEIKHALIARGVDISGYRNKREMINKALRF